MPARGLYAAPTLPPAADSPGAARPSSRAPGPPAGRRPPHGAGRADLHVPAERGSIGPYFVPQARRPVQATRAWTLGHVREREEHFASGRRRIDWSHATTKNDTTAKPILVLGSTGRTGSRVAAQLRQRGHEVRGASRKGPVAFDWTDENTWEQTLEGAGAAYLVDSQLPDAAASMRSFAELAVASGV
ncbi:SDR family oxidoreductase [Streptomyces venezuelae]|uniref:SDR family oxidoreductase n=1 Tax=Streptomyces venezuelae TaxID=54571 RepID=UPI0029589025|nr:NAD-dependent epimerase/dehydratase family protein [Streptomyces venezuelae]